MRTPGRSWPCRNGKGAGVPERTNVWSRDAAHPARRGRASICDHVREHGGQAMSMSSAEYEDQGYMFRPGLLGAAEVSPIIEELDRIVAGPARSGMVLEKDGVTLRSVFNPHVYSDVFDHVVRHPRILGTVEELLGEPVYAFQMVVNNKAA